VPSLAEAVCGVAERKAELDLDHFDRLKAMELANLTRRH
jgi:hypothetical protein